MPRARWNLLYLTLQAMALGDREWAGWRHVRVFVDVERFAGATFERDDGERVDIYAAEHCAHPPPFHRTRHFELSTRSHRDADPAGLPAAFARAFETAERTLLDRARG
jgi:hypothetical protein